MSKPPVIDWSKIAQITRKDGTPIIYAAPPVDLQRVINQAKYQAEKVRIKKRRMRRTNEHHTKAP
jgi:hypothetical protein